MLDMKLLSPSWEEILSDPQVLKGSITGWTVGVGKLRGPLTEVRDYRGVITITSAWTASLHEHTEPKFQDWYRRGGTTWSIDKALRRPWKFEGGYYIAFLAAPYSLCFFTLASHGGAEHLDTSKLLDIPIAA
jgi:hypothetical protein